MLRTLSLLTVFALMGGTLQEASGQVIFEDDFSRVDFNDVAGGKWIVHGTTQSINGDPDDSSNPVLYNHTANHFRVDGLESLPLLDRPALGQQLMIEGRFQHDEFNPRCASNLFLKPTWTFQAEKRIYLEFAKDQVGDDDQIFAGQGSDVDVRGTFVPGQWHNWKVILFASGCEIYVDGICLYYTTVGDFPVKICLDGSRPTQTSYWDDINVTLQDLTPPIVSCEISDAVLWPPNKKLVDIGLTVLAEDDTDPEPSVEVLVYSDEDDGVGKHSPDSAYDGESLLLRSERLGNEDGRVYLLVVIATDASGNSDFGCCTVVVPHDQSEESVTDVISQAAAAQIYCEDFGEAPPGFVLLGEE